LSVAERHVLDKVREMGHAAGECAAASTPTLPRSKILVINDSPDFLNFMRDFLTAEGAYDVATYDQSEGVLEQVTSAPPDLVILDIVFRNGPTGVEVARQLAETAATAHIPVLFCTALSPRELGDDLRRLAAETEHRILYKPFDLDELLQHLTEMLSPPEHAVDQ
jgi:CheY-like chemotaxis protein